MPAISALPISAPNPSNCSAAAFITCCSPIGSKPRSLARKEPEMKPDMDQRIRTDRALPPLRPEREVAPETTGKIGDVARPLTLIERLANMTLVRRLAVLVVLAVAWELYARYLDNPLFFPSLSQTLAAFWDAAAHGVLIDRTLTSLRILGMGYALGLLAAAVFTTLAVSTHVGTDFLSTLTAMFNPLPAIALLPLALLWFGLGAPSIVFVIVNSVLWAVSLNTHAGCM